MHQNGWFTSADLKDVHFHIPIYPAYTKYLGFTFQEICYPSYRLITMCPLLVCLSLNRWVFIQSTEAAIAPMRWQDIHLATYLYD